MPKPDFVTGVFQELTDEPPSRSRDSIRVNDFGLRVGAHSNPQQTNDPDEKHLRLYE